MAEKKAAAYRTLFYVFIGLSILTGVEFAVSQVTSSTIAMMIIALLKTILIVNYFMHVYRLWSEEEH